VVSEGTAIAKLATVPSANKERMIAFMVYLNNRSPTISCGAGFLADKMPAPNQSQ
jgi:hypothetical protein